METEPFVSIVIAIRNEEVHIRECLEALLNQNYPEDKYEIIVVDGMSEDKTKEIVKNVNEAYNNRIKFLENPKKLASPGRNIGIKEAIGDYVGVFGGHTIASKNWIKELIKILINADENIAAIGSTTLTGNPTPLTEAQEFVLSSKFGGFKTDEAKQIDLRYKKIKKKDVFESNSLCFLLYKKKVLIDVGLNDETLFSGDDAELHIRFRKAGYKFLGTRKAKVYFYRRDTIKKVFKRIYEFGQARAIIIKKHPDTFRFFWIIPPLFVIFLIFFGIFNIFTFLLNVFNYNIFNYTLFLSLNFDVVIYISYLTIIAFYFALNLIFSFSGLRYFKFKKSVIYTILLFPCIHIGFGLGFIRGFFPYKRIKPQR